MTLLDSFSDILEKDGFMRERPEQPDSVRNSEHCLDAVESLPRRQVKLFKLPRDAGGGLDGDFQFRTKLLCDDIEVPARLSCRRLDELLQVFIHQDIVFVSGRV